MERKRNERDEMHKRQDTVYMCMVTIFLFLRSREYPVTLKRNTFRMHKNIYFLTEWTSLVAQWQRICLPMQETWVRSLGQEDPLEKEVAAHSSVVAWRIPWTEEPGGLQPTGSGRNGRGLVAKQPPQQCS